ncbi:MAG: response regulator [Anaerolineae bacterium]|nr:response regulator [Anaerolineae bacterium]
MGFEPLSPQTLRFFSILVVEDDPMLNDLYTRVLKHKGLSVKSATSLAEARQRLANFAPDLIILDLGLGNDAGEQVLDLLRLPQLRHVRVIVVSGHAFDPRRLPNREQVEYTLLKPVSPRQLAELVQEHAEKRLLAV